MSQIRSNFLKQSQPKAFIEVSDMIAFLSRYHLDYPSRNLSNHIASEMPSRKNFQCRLRKANSNPHWSYVAGQQSKSVEKLRIWASIHNLSCLSQLHWLLQQNLGKNRHEDHSGTFRQNKKTLLNHWEVAQDASLMGVVRSIFVSNGVDWTLQKFF